MDYQEEQANEMEALESIYCDDLEVSDRDPYKFSVAVKSEAGDGDGENEGDVGLSCVLKFVFTPKYPEELPLMEIADPVNFEESDLEELRDHLTEEGNQNLNVAMIFTLVSKAQEWVNSKWDEIKLRKESEAEKKLKQQEEEERKRFEGTKVTVETFMAWKKAFEQDVGSAKKSLIKVDKETRKLTGKEQFLQDQTLIESDLQFLENEGETIKVDESLFQDLDELDLEENET